MEKENQVRPLLESARNLYQRGEYSEAIKTYQEVLDKDNRLADAYTGQADSLSCLWRYEEAIVKYRKSLEIDPKPETYTGLGNALYDLRRCREAIDNHQEAANIYLKQATEARTRAAQEEAEEADGNYSDSCNDLGFDYLCVREYDQAIAKLRDAIEKGKKYPYAHHSLASVFWIQGKYKDAMAEWRTARGLYLKCSDEARKEKWKGHFLYFGNMLHEVFGELDEAERVYKEGLKLDENYLDILISLVALYLERKDDNPKERNNAYWDAQRFYNAAKRLLAKVLTNARDLESLLLMGELAMTMGEYDEAEALLDEARLKQDAHLKDENEAGRYVESAKPKADLGILCMRRKQFKEAIQYFEEAVKIDADDLSLRSNLAEAYLKDGQLEDAEREFQRVLETAPDHIESLIGLGGVYTALGDTGDPDMYDAAIVRYSEAIALAGRNTGSKRLKKKELAAVLYSRGYARVKFCEASKTPKDRGPLYAARSDFRDCFKNDTDQYKAKRAVEKIDKVLPPRSPQRFMEQWGPSVILVFSIIVFLLSQISFVWSFLDKSRAPTWLRFLDQAQHLTVNQYVALTFGSLVLMVASCYLPQLLKLKVPGIELEKTVVDQITTLGPVGISKAS